MLLSAIITLPRIMAHQILQTQSFHIPSDPAVQNIFTCVPFPSSAWAAIFLEQPKWILIVQIASLGSHLTMDTVVAVQRVQLSVSQT